MNAASELRHTDITEVATPQRQSEVVARLRAVLDAHCVLYREEDTRPYECDGLAAFRQLPMVVVLPETEAQVQRVLRICHELDVPVVARGAGTGLSGGAMPHAVGRACCRSPSSTASCAIDPLARIARVQPGVRNLAISDAAAPYGLYYAPDPSSQIACTHRRQRRRELRRRALPEVRAHGAQRAARARRARSTARRSSSAREALDAPGLDLLALMIGSEGMLAVVTEVTVKLVPKPPLARVVMASFDDVEKAGDAVARDHRRRHHPRRAGDDGPARPRARSSRSCRPATTSTRRRSCLRSPTARPRRSPRRSRA